MTGTDVSLLGAEIMLPDSGEIVALDDPAACAKALAALREFKRRVDGARADLEAALVHHAQHAGTKTLHLDGATVKVAGGEAVEWDVTVLLGLLDAGLPAERYAQLVREEVTYKVDARVAKSVEAAGNPEYARIIASARRTVSRPWRVTVT